MRQGRELQRQLLQAHLDLRARREQQTVPAARVAVHWDGTGVAGADGVVRRRIETGHHRLLATVLGTVRVTRCAWRAPNAANLYPADVAPSLPGRRHSHGLARLAVAEAVRGSFDTAHAAMTARCGPVIGKRQIEDLIVASAQDIDAFYAEQTPVPRTGEELLVLSFDGKGIAMRPSALRPATRKAAARAKRAFRTRLAAGEKPARKRMATLGVVYDAEPGPRRPHDVIAVPGGRHGTRPPRPGPHAMCKWLCGSVIDDPDTVIGKAFDHAHARDPVHARPWIVLVDGARHQLDLIEVQATRRGITITIVIDFVHVLERLWTAAWSLHAPADPAAEDRVAAWALALLAGQVHHVIADLKHHADTLPDDRRHGIDTTIGYLTNNIDHLRYDHALRQGWPIATGVIEGACRHLIADRFGLAGARWGLPGAEAMLKLRALTTNQDLDRYWAYHLRREHERTHHQYEYALTA